MQLEQYQKGIEMYKNDENAVLIITHNTKNLKPLKSRLCTCISKWTNSKKHQQLN